MKFSYFHLMPYHFFDEPQKDWPTRNTNFDPKKAQELYTAYTDMMARAEDLGFDWVGCNEHHFSPYGLMANCNLIGAALVHRTKNIRLAMCGNLLPILNPIRVAEEYAMLDVMSGGRLIAGFMRGIAHEYIAYNTAPDESWERMAEAHDLIVKCWTEKEPFGWEGKYYKFPAISIWPKPFQQPHPPILMSASSIESARFAAERRAIMGIVRLPGYEQALESIKVYRDTALTNGWKPGPEHVLIGAFTCVADTFDQARAHLERGLDYFFNVLNGGVATAQRIVMQKTRYYQEERTKAQRAQHVAAQRSSTIDERIETGQVLCGTPEMVVEQITRMNKIFGHGIMNVNMKVGNIPNDVVNRSMQLWSEHVLPHVRHL
jgi:alkanesulfonate monooxygenase SsuD/methylene tetrahydromethanopterin reductase-like flavin-dependent oxidoreductase (luciferase family)